MFDTSGKNGRQPAVRDFAVDSFCRVLSVRTANTKANGHGVAVEVAHCLDRAQGQAVACFGITEGAHGATLQQECCTTVQGCGGKPGQGYQAIVERGLK